MAAVGDRPRLLFLCQTVPYPPDGGVWIRTYHVLRLLARAFDITALCFERAPMPGNAAATDVAASRAALARFAHLDVFPVPQRRSRLRYLWDHGRSAATGQVYTRYMFESRAFRGRLAHILASQQPDLVHIDSIDLAAYLPACGGLPVACVHHDVNSRLLHRRADVERRRWRRAYLRHQAALTEKAEREWCERVTLNVVVSERDGVVLRRIAPGARIGVVPNGVDVDHFHPEAAGDDNGVAFVGGLHWSPNLDALQFFCADILPHLRAGGRAMRVRWIGSGSSGLQQSFRDRFDVDVTGYVDDVRPAMRDAACHVVPLRAGGGTRLKILNSWAMGKPVVTTSIGCEGLHAVDGENVLIRDEPKAFAEAVLAVLGNRELRQRLGECGRETVERQYSWDIVGRGLIETYRTIANGGTRDMRPVGADIGYLHAGLS